ncbi:MAG: hypothetical protein ACKOX6_10605 [Bdellovibrio sp.]
MKHLVVPITLLSIFSLTGFSAQAAETEVLKPFIQCQSQEFVADDAVRAVVLKDKLSGQIHVDLSRTSFGGVEKFSYQVYELINTGMPGVPRIYAGDGLRLSIQSTLNANEQYLSATLSVQIDERTTQDDSLICLPIYN